jgi:hypothetical protein
MPAGGRTMAQTGDIPRQRGNRAAATGPNAVAASTIDPEAKGGWCPSRSSKPVRRAIPGGRVRFPSASATAAASRHARSHLTRPPLARLLGEVRLPSASATLRLLGGVRLPSASPTGAAPDHLGRHIWGRVRAWRAWIPNCGHAPGWLRLSCNTQVLPSGSLKSANEP